MKKTDIAMIILIVSISVLVTYFVAKAVIGDVSKQSVKVKTAEAISAELVQPDPAVFNTNAINPTVEVTIGGNGSASSALQGAQ
jgi:flagellar basal body-associated protein FliL